MNKPSSSGSVFALAAVVTALSGCAAAAAPPAKAASSPPASGVEALIKRQSQEFSDASASGDGAVLGRYLDDRVVFMNEDGDVATKKDIVESATPAPKGVGSTLTQTDWAIEVHASVAVTRFTDVAAQQFHGQSLHASFRSTEVWLKEDDGAWRMISSQTMAVPEDPPAVTLPSAMLDQYVGTYAAASDLTYKVARDGDTLTGVIGDGKPSVIKAELVDVFFTPGQPRARKIFERDAGGKITGFVIRREGHDVRLKRVA